MFNNDPVLTRMLIGLVAFLLFLAFLAYWPDKKEKPEVKPEIPKTVLPNKKEIAKPRKRNPKKSISKK